MKLDLHAVSFASAFNFTNNLNALNRDHSLTDYIIDLVFKSIKLWNFLRMNDMVVTGGEALTWNLNIGQSPNTVWYQGDQDLPIASMNANIYTAALDWKWLDDALTVLMTDVLINDGSPDAVANAVASQIDVMKMSSVQAAAKAFIVNNQTVNPLAFDGLSASIDNGQVVNQYAGISTTSAITGSLWSSNINYNMGGGAALLGNMQTQDIAAQIDNSRPDHYATNKLFYGAIIGQLTSLDRYIQPDLARTFGATDLAFNGCPLFMDNNIPTGVASPTAGGSGGYMYGLNSRYLKLVVMEGCNFDLEDWRRAEQNNTYFTRLHFAGNVVNMKPPAHWGAWVTGM